MENTGRGFFADMPPWAKGILGVGGGLIVWRIYKDMTTGKDAREEVQKTNVDLTTSKKKVAPTYTKSQYELWANQIEDYCFDLGTDQTGINNIFKKLKNDTDFLELNSAFGAREYWDWGIPYGKKTLGSWLALEDSWGEYLVQGVNDILKSKGIKYRY